jgi:hypothetical protein
MSPHQEEPSVFRAMTARVERMTTPTHGDTTRQ